MIEPPALDSRDTAGTERRRCLLCGEYFAGPQLTGASLLAHFEDLCICAGCLEREQGGGHGKH